MRPGACSHFTAVSNREGVTSGGARLCREISLERDAGLPHRRNHTLAFQTKGSSRARGGACLCRELSLEGDAGLLHRRDGALAQPPLVCLIFRPVLRRVRPRALCSKGKPPSTAQILSENRLQKAYACPPRRSHVAPPCPLGHSLRTEDHRHRRRNERAQRTLERREVRGRCLSPRSPGVPPRPPAHSLHFRETDVNG